MDKHLNRIDAKIQSWEEIKITAATWKQNAQRPVLAEQLSAQQTVFYEYKNSQWKGSTKAMTTM